MTPPIRRRLVVGLPLVAAMGALLGCESAPPATSVPPIASEPNVVIRNTAAGATDSVLVSIAAFATVQAVDTASREVVLTARNGGTFGLRAPPEFRTLGRLRTGTRVVVEYDANGAMRLALPPRANAQAFSGRMRATIESVEIGGRRVTVVGADGLRRTLSIPDPAMMAFATRLGPGDEIGVTTLQR
jgi:hypothetical protein